MAKKKFLFSYQKFFDNELVSARVEQGSKADIILLFNSERNLSFFDDTMTALFTSTGTVRTCNQIVIIGTQGGTGYHMIALTMSSAYALNNPITLVFDPTLKGKTATITVTNAITS